MTMGTMILPVDLAPDDNTRRWRKSDLARALPIDPRQVDPLRYLRDGPPVAQSAALAACGQTVRVEWAAVAA